MSFIYKGQTIANVGGSGGGSSEEIYSTEETRIGTWIDGRPLYRVVVNVPSSSISNGKSIPLPVSNVDTVWNIGGCVVELSIDGGSVNRTRPIPAIYQGDDLSVEISSMFGIVFSRSGSAYVGMNMVLILEYTKTTDEGAIS